MANNERIKELHKFGRDCINQAIEVIGRDKNICIRVFLSAGNSKWIKKGDTLMAEIPLGKIYDISRVSTMNRYDLILTDYWQLLKDLRLMDPVWERPFFTYHHNEGLDYHHDTSGNTNKIDWRVCVALEQDPNLPVFFINGEPKYVNTYEPYILNGDIAHAVPIQDSKRIQFLMTYAQQGDFTQEQKEKNIFPPIPIHLFE